MSKWEFKFDEHGNPFKVNPATGEVRLGAERPVFEGDKIVTPEQQEANKKYIDSLKRAAGRRTASRDLGKYGVHRERFLSIVGDGLDKGSHRLYVNPRVLYSGSDYKQVAILGRFSED